MPYAVMGVVSDAECHVTLVVTAARSADDVRALVADVDTSLEPLLPIECRLGEVVPLDEDAADVGMDAYEVLVDDVHTAERLRAFWARHRDRRRRPVADWAPHVRLTSVETVRTMHALNASCRSRSLMMCELVVCSLDGSETVYRARRRLNASPQRAGADDAVTVSS